MESKIYYTVNILVPIQGSSIITSIKFEEVDDANKIEKFLIDTGSETAITVLIPIWENWFVKNNIEYKIAVVGSKWSPSYWLTKLAIRVQRWMYKRLGEEKYKESMNNGN